MKTVLVFVLGAVVGFLIGMQWSSPTPKAVTYDRTIAVEPIEKPAPPPAAASAPASAPVVVAKKLHRVKKEPRAAKAPTPEDIVKIHEESSTDGDWAQLAADTLEADFQRIEVSHSFAVSGIDCRVSSCLVSVEWDSYAHAQASKDEIVGAAYSLTCSKRIVAPPGKAAGGMFRATLLFYDCRR